MSSRISLLFLLAAGTAAAQYKYDLFDSLVTQNPQWNAYGNAQYLNSQGGAQGVTFPYSGGSLIYQPAVTGANSNDYEVASQIVMDNGGGTYMHILRASGGVVPGYGSYVSAEFVFPVTMSYNNAVVPARATVQLNINQRLNGSTTQLASVPVGIAWGSMIRTVIFGTTVWVFVDNVHVADATVVLTTGQPGIGGKGMADAADQVQGNLPTQLTGLVKIGKRETVAPTPVSAQGIASYLLPNSVSLKWQPSQDDPNGTGLFRYDVTRLDASGNPTYLGYLYGPFFADSASQPSTAYTYQIAATDYHGNSATTSVALTTPPAQAIDSRRIGIQPTGSYWGGGGEQIDTRSGNLNFSLPLLQQKGRTGWTVPIGLSYNSQNWRRDSGGVDWQLGSDVGYGFGWKLLIGSITPFYNGQWGAVDHYVYTDSSGAEYRLDVNNNNVWSSRQSIYAWFDANADRLYFNNGTFWYMGCVSAGTEPDAGTLYPTIIQDATGNQVAVIYAAAATFAGYQQNTSGRIQGTTGQTSYTFSYSSDSPKHLTYIRTPLGSFSLAYESAALGSPFGTNPVYANDTGYFLSTVTAPTLSMPYTFTYDVTNSGELAEAIFPYGGHIRWGYQTFSFADGATWREVNQRYVAASSTGTPEWTYNITRSDYSAPPGAPATVHSDMTVVDASGVGAKTWTFSTQANGVPGWQTGLLSSFSELSAPNGYLFQTSAFSWSQNAAGNAYISSAIKTSDPGTPSQQVARTDQTQDQYGNTLQSIQYTNNNTTAPFRTYNTTWQTGSAYISAHIVNLPLSTTLTFADPFTGNPVTKTLVTNYYDGAQPSNTQGLTWPPAENYPYSYPSPYTWISASGVSSLWNPPSRWSNPRGLLTFATTPSVASSYTWWDFGAMNQATRSDGKTTNQSADLSTAYYAPQSISTETYSASISYDPWLNITGTTGANGESATTTYDSVGRPSVGQSPYGMHTTYSYSTQLPATQTAQVGSGSSGPYTTATLDGFGRTIRVETGTFTSGGQTPVSWVDTVYAPCACSPLGKIQKVSQPYAPGGTPVWTVYTYDGLGRTVSVQQPDGASTATYFYSGNQTAVTDPAGNWKSFTKDQLGNLTSVVEPDPSSTTGGTLTTSYTYDWMNHVSQVSMTRAGTTQTRTFVYNDAGLLTSATNPENGAVSYVYNADNTLQYKQDAKGQATVYSYDSVKRVTMAKRYPQGQANPEDVCQRVTYNYDSGPPSYYGATLLQIYTTGRLAYTQWGSQTISCFPNSPPTSYTELYDYSRGGAPAAKQLLVTRSGTTSTLTASYGYNTAGTIASATYPSWNPSSPIQPVYNYGFDIAYRPVSLTESDNSVAWVQNVQYDLANRLVGRQFAVNTTTSGGVTTPVLQSETRGYNALGQLTSLAWAGVGSLGYVYSATSNNGQIQQMSDSVSGETVVYQYDSLKRLTSASSTPMGGPVQPWTQSFQYDGFGNLNAKVLNGTTQPIQVNLQTNQLSNAFYDANGNMISGVGATFAYDEANRLASSAEVSGGIEYYGYAPDNKRIYHQFPNGKEEWMFYGPGGELMGKYTLSATTGQFSPTLLNVWFGGRLVATQTVSSVNTRTTNPVLLDRLGTNRAVGARFYPFGDEITSTSNDREKFATYTRDSYTGLDYANQRYFASTYGRFNTTDPYRRSARANVPMSWDRYTYCENDPVNCSDPTGLVDWWQVGSGVVQVVSGGITLGAQFWGAPPTLGVSLIGALGSAGLIANGAVTIMAGLTAPSNQISPSVSQNLTTAGQVTSVGGLVGGVLTGGNQTAITAGAVVSGIVSLGQNLTSITNPAAGAATVVGGWINLGSDLNGLVGNLTAGAPTVVPGTVVNVNDTATPVEMVPSVTPGQLDFGGFNTGCVALDQGGAFCG